MKSGWALAAMAAVLLAGPAPAWAADDAAVFVRKDAKAETLKQDQTDCETRAKTTYYQVPPPVAPHPYGLVGAIMDELAVPGLDAKARVRATAACMRHKGYAKVMLTGEEASALKALKTQEEQTAWTERFTLGLSDARLQQAATPAVPLLPKATDADDPFVFGAIRMDPATLTLATQPIGKGEILMRGKASRRRTAIVTVEWKDRFRAISERIPAGSLFHEFLEPQPWDADLSDDRTAWCGKFKGIGRPVCLRSTFDGYDVIGGNGLRMEDTVGYVGGENSFAEPFTKPITMEVQPENRTNTLDFYFVLTRMKDDKIIVTGKIANDKIGTEFLHNELEFDAQGQARIPLWDRTLVLTRKAEAVITTFEPRSDRKGPAFTPVRQRRMFG